MLAPFTGIDDIGAGRRVLIYGAGTAGVAFARYLGNLGVTAAAFLDTRRTGRCEGLEVIRFADYAAGRRRPEDRVIVASSFVREIAITLAASGITDALDAARFSVSVGSYAGRLLGLLEDGRLRLDAN